MSERNVTGSLVLVPNFITGECLPLLVSIVQSSVTVAIRQILLGNDRLSILVKNLIEISTIVYVSPNLVRERLRSDAILRPVIILVSEEVAIQSFVLLPELPVLERKETVLDIHHHRNKSIVEETRERIKVLVIDKTRHVIIGPLDEINVILNLIVERYYIIEFRRVPRFKVVNILEPDAESKLV